MRVVEVDRVPAIANAPARRASHEAITAAVRAGLTGSEVARLHGVSRERVRQIVKRDLGISLRRPSVGRYCITCDGKFQKGHTASAAHAAGRARRQAAKFWQRVQKTSSCWLWRGARYPTGYGHTGLFMELGHGGYVHRLSYIWANGPIPQGHQVDHLCRVAACLNPDHLEAVTPRTNILRSPNHVAAINARKTRCNRGHPFSPENTRRDGKGRTCRTCARDRERARRAAGYVRPSRRRAA